MSPPELFEDVALHLLADLQRHQRKGVPMEHPSAFTPTGSDRDTALLLAAVVCHAGGHIVLDPADLRDVAHVHLAIDMKADGTVEITVSVTERAV